VSARRREEDQSFAGWVVTTPVNKSEIQQALQEKAFADEVQQMLVDFQKRLATQAAEVAKVGTPSPDLAQAAFKDAVATVRLMQRKKKLLIEHASHLGVADFMIYAPENTVLRTPPPESAIQPLGTRGEGLFKLLQSFGDTKFSDRLAELKQQLHLFGWFDDFVLPDAAATTEARLHIKDRWLRADCAVFDQRSANEGFLYVLFYLTLLTSWRTPNFFAVDNIDNALNPKLCSALMLRVVKLAKKYKKQIICTTHNPAILDGLNLNDDEQRLYTVRRDSDGHTMADRVRPPSPQQGEPPVKLSDAFLSGAIGGLPEYF
jgi:predicted ATPase